MGELGVLLAAIRFKFGVFRVIATVEIQVGRAQHDPLPIVGVFKLGLLEILGGVFAVAVNDAGNSLGLG